MTSYLRPRFALHLLGACALLIAGCGESGPKTAPVTGKITYKGKPVGSGTILFMPLGDKPTATGEINADGAYSLTTGDAEGAVLGPHKIMIMAVEDQSGKLPDQQSATPKLIVPIKYSDYNSSGLTADVKDEPNVFNFDLKD